MSAAKPSIPPQGIEGQSALEALAKRAPRLANVVEALSRRADVRELRAKLLGLVLELRCPPSGAPRRPWYVPGALARVGAEGLRRSWRGFYGENAPCLRTVRAHLGVLRRGGAIALAPGDFLPGDYPQADYRPRFADTIHVVDDDAGAEWWAQVGAKLLARHPEARTNPTVWRALFAGWRERARNAALDLRGTLFEGLEHLPPIRSGRARDLELEAETTTQAAVQGLPRAQVDPNYADHVTTALEPAELAAGFRRLAAHARASVFELFAGMRELGCEIRGRPLFELAQSQLRLRGTLAMLAVAFARGDRIRNRSGWVVRNHRFAGDHERERALWLCTAGPNQGAGNAHDTFPRARARDVAATSES